MALRQYTPERREVKAKGQVLGEVRGLALEDVAVLVREHLPDLDALVELFNNPDAMDSMSVEDWKKLALPIITQAPGLAANVIALAADAPDGGPTVQTWPVGAQLEALVSIFEMTISEVGEIKKAWGIVAALLAQKKTRTTGAAKKTGKAK